MKFASTALRMLIFMTLLTGVAYPLLVTGLSQVLFRDKASGSYVQSQGELRGSELIGQKFESDQYFSSRPSASDYNAQASGGSNQGPTSAALKKAVDERANNLKSKNPEGGVPPQDLLFASGSGLDPHISVASANYQVARLAQARQLDISAVRQLINNFTEPRQFGIFGEPRVNVLMLNLAIDQLSLAKAK